jgi:hypothetical protein
MATPEQCREFGKLGGRPRDPTSEHYRKTLLKAVMIKKEELAAALIAKGLSGDVPALREIHDRVLGKPPMVLNDDSKGFILQTILVERANGSKENQAVPAAG